MPARCTKGFLFEDDLTNVTLRASLCGPDSAALTPKQRRARSMEERWRLHCETCPSCSRSDTEPEACLREEYQWKRAQFQGALSADIAGLPTAGLSLAAIRRAGIASGSTRQLLGELESLRRLLLNKPPRSG